MDVGRVVVGGSSIEGFMIKVCTAQMECGKLVYTGMCRGLAVGREMRR